MTPAASTLRRIDVFWMAEEVIDLHYEFKEKGTLFKKAICPSTRGYNKREHNRAKRKLHAFLKEYRKFYGVGWIRPRNTHEAK
jgi:hypothetical protein